MTHRIKTRTKKAIIECLACEEGVYVGRDPKIGDYIYCHNCDAEFQITDLDPILIDWPDEEDYFDQEEGYYDEIHDENDF